MNGSWARAAHSRHKSIAVTMAATLAGFGATAHASEDTAASGLEEIVVTAQKRVESIQDVPISITAMTAEDLRNARLTDADALVSQVPNLQQNGISGQGLPIFSLRGVSMNDFSANQSSPVASYVDDVYKGSTALFGVQLFDLERVEVLRGPQGTLYGKNSTGGAVKFITHRPEFENAGEITVGTGNYGRIEGEGAVQAVLIDDVLAGRLAGTYRKQDGYIDNKLSGKPDLSATDEYALRASLLFRPSDTLSIVLRAAGSKSDPINFGVYTEASPAGIGGGLYSALNALDPTRYPNVDYFRSGLGKLDTETGRALKRSAEAQSASATIEWELAPSLQLTSITSWDHGELLVPEDTDGSPLRVLQSTNFARARQLAEEARLTSNFDGPFDFILGAYVSDERVHARSDIGFYEDLDLDGNGALDNGDCLASLIGSSPAPFPAGCELRNRFDQQRQSAALYGDATYKLADPLTLRIGARYSHDEAELKRFRSVLTGSDGVALLNFIPGDPANLDATTGRDFSDEQLSGKVGLDWWLTDDVMLYGSYSRGYRAGAFNAQAFFSIAELTAVEPEQLDAYEIGFKSELLGRALRLNGAAFYYKYRDQQALDVDPASGAQLLVNIGESTIKGGELELTALPHPSLRLRAGVGVLSTRIDAGMLRGESLRGNELPMAPGVTGTLAIDWDAYSGDSAVLALHADGSYSDTQYFDLFATRALAQSAYTLLNGRIAFHSPDDNWEIAVWGKNLTDEFLLTAGTDLGAFGFNYFHILPPRTYGVEATLRF